MTTETESADPTSRPGRSPGTDLRASIPSIGLGTWPLVGDDAENAVRRAIDIGYRHIDTATVYGNEDAVGRAVVGTDVPRDELFVTSKLHGPEHISGDIHGAVERSLDRMGLDYLDMYLIHWPLPRFDRYVEAFDGLLQCREAGLIRHAGVSNFLGKHLRRVAESVGEAPELDQIQMDPTLCRIPVRQVADELGVAVSAWSPLGRGDALDHPVVVEIAAERGYTPAQIILAWHLGQGVIPVARSASPTRQAENLAAGQIELSAAEIARLDRLDRGESAARDVETEEHI
ncbi:aldo/keto reductase [Gordonia desulfuricans]|uniref:Aldo/keto reductase n=1 Tax=Gordonia desulfuricans TaxID=89051 RepID=A0A7K3LRW0_9ACTN|nr:aldo/keto reductase [Gordonia desulfuricans]NDK90287.1 aldo/keto reductase [Gordonia desulfuricans]